MLTRRFCAKAGANALEPISRVKLIPGRALRKFLTLVRTLSKHSQPAKFSEEGFCGAVRLNPSS